MLECEENTPTFDVEPKKATFSFAFPEGESQTNVILSASEISHDLSEKKYMPCCSSVGFFTVVQNDV